MKRSLLFKFISGILAILFVLNDIGHAAPVLDLSPLSRLERLRMSSLSLPAELGSIEDWQDSTDAGSQKIILHIQDAHANQTAQKHTSELIRYLHDNYGFKTLLVEGAAEQLDAKWLGKQNEASIEQNLESGKFSGADLYLLSNPGKIKALPLEDIPVYRRNYSALRAVFSESELTQSFLETLSQKLDLRASKSFTQKSLHLFREWEKFQSGRREFLPFLKALADDSKQLLGIDFEAVGSQIDWPQITRLLVLQKIEKKLLSKNSNVQKQKQEILARLKFLNAHADLIKGFEKLDDRFVSSGKIQAGSRLVTPREFLELWIAFEQRHGFDFKVYRDFLEWAGAFVLKSEIQPGVLFSEIEKLFDRLLTQTAQSAEQKNLLRIYRDKVLLSKLLSLELSRSEWQAALDRRREIEPAALVENLKGAAPNDSVLFNQLKSVCDAAFEFYSAAFDRESVFETKLREAFKVNPKLILITGGFHSEGMKDFFRRENAAYGSIMPRITDLGSPSLYRSMMLDDSGDFARATLAGIDAAQRPEVRAEMRSAMPRPQNAAVSIRSEGRIPDGSIWNRLFDSQDSLKSWLQAVIHSVQHADHDSLALTGPKMGEIADGLMLDSFFANPLKMDEADTKALSQIIYRLRAASAALSSHEEQRADWLLAEGIFHNLRDKILDETFERIQKAGAGEMERAATRKFTDWFHFSRTNYASFASEIIAGNSKKKIIFVLSHPKPDFDAVVSSVGEGYSQFLKYENNPDILVVPLLHSALPANELHPGYDTLMRFGILPTDLMTWNEILKNDQWFGLIQRQSTAASPQIEIVLVDHAEDVLAAKDQPLIKPLTTLIVDHHKQPDYLEKNDGLPVKGDVNSPEAVHAREKVSMPRLQERAAKKMGSTATLIAHHFNEANRHMPKALEMFLLMSIIIDSENKGSSSYQRTGLDEAMFHFLSRNLKKDVFPGPFDESLFFDSYLIQVVLNGYGLSPQQVFLKDVKWSDAGSRKVRIGSTDRLRQDDVKRLWIDIKPLMENFSPSSDEVEANGEELATNPAAVIHRFSMWGDGQTWFAVKAPDARGLIEKTLQLVPGLAKPVIENEPDSDIVWLKIPGIVQRKDVAKAVEAVLSARSEMRTADNFVSSYFRRSELRKVDISSAIAHARPAELAQVMAKSMTTELAKDEESLSLILNVSNPNLYRPLISMGWRQQIAFPERITRVEFDESKSPFVLLVGLQDGRTWRITLLVKDGIETNKAVYQRYKASKSDALTRSWKQIKQMILDGNAVVEGDAFELLSKKDKRSFLTAINLKDVGERILSNEEAARPKDGEDHSASVGVGGGDELIKEIGAQYDAAIERTLAGLKEILKVKIPAIVQSDNLAQLEKQVESLKALYKDISEIESSLTRFNSEKLAQLQGITKTPEKTQLVKKLKVPESVSIAIRDAKKSAADKFLAIAAPLKSFLEADFKLYKPEEESAISVWEADSLHFDFDLNAQRAEAVKLIADFESLSQLFEGIDQRRSDYFKNYLSWWSTFLLPSESLHREISDLRNSKTDLTASRLKNIQTRQSTNIAELKSRIEEFDRQTVAAESQRRSEEAALQVQLDQASAARNAAITKWTRWGIWGAASLVILAFVFWAIWPVPQPIPAQAHSNQGRLPPLRDFSELKAWFLQWNTNYSIDLGLRRAAAASRMFSYDIKLIDRTPGIKNVELIRAALVGKGTAGNTELPVRWIEIFGPSGKKSFLESDLSVLIALIPEYFQLEGWSAAEAVDRNSAALFLLRALFLNELDADQIKDSITAYWKVLADVRTGAAGETNLLLSKMLTQSSVKSMTNELQALLPAESPLFAAISAYLNPQANAAAARDDSSAYFVILFNSIYSDSKIYASDMPEDAKKAVFSRLASALNDLTRRADFLKRAEAYFFVVQKKGVVNYQKFSGLIDGLKKNDTDLENIFRRYLLSEASLVTDSLIFLKSAGVDVSELFAFSKSYYDELNRRLNEVADKRGFISEQVLSRIRSSGSAARSDKFVYPDVQNFYSVVIGESVQRTPASLRGIYASHKAEMEAALLRQDNVQITLDIESYDSIGFVGKSADQNFAIVIVKPRGGPSIIFGRRITADPSYKGVLYRLNFRDLGDQIEVTSKGLAITSQKGGKTFYEWADIKSWLDSQIRLGTDNRSQAGVQPTADEISKAHQSILNFINQYSLTEEEKKKFGAVFTGLSRTLDYPIDPELKKHFDALKIKPVRYWHVKDSEKNLPGPTAQSAVLASIQIPTGNPVMPLRDYGFEAFLDHAKILSVVVSEGKQVVPVLVQRLLLEMMVSQRDWTISEIQERYSKLNQRSETRSGFLLDAPSSAREEITQRNKAAVSSFLRITLIMAAGNIAWLWYLLNFQNQPGSERKQPVAIKENQSPNDVSAAPRPEIRKIFTDALISRSEIRYTPLDWTVGTVAGITAALGAMYLFSITGAGIVAVLLVSFLTLISVTVFITDKSARFLSAPGDDFQREKRNFNILYESLARRVVKMVGAPQEALDWLLEDSRIHLYPHFLTPHFSHDDERIHIGFAGRDVFRTRPRRLAFELAHEIAHALHYYQNPDSIMKRVQGPLSEAFAASAAYALFPDEARLDWLNVENFPVAAEAYSAFLADSEAQQQYETVLVAAIGAAREKYAEADDEELRRSGLSDSEVHRLRSAGKINWDKLPYALIADDELGLEMTDVTIEQKVFFEQYWLWLGLQEKYRNNPEVVGRSVNLAQDGHVHADGFLLMREMLREDAGYDEALPARAKHWRKIVRQTWAVINTDPDEQDAAAEAFIDKWKAQAVNAGQADAQSDSKEFSKGILAGWLADTAEFLSRARFEFFVRYPDFSALDADRLAALYDDAPEESDLHDELAAKQMAHLLRTMPIWRNIQLQLADYLTANAWPFKEADGATVDERWKSAQLWLEKFQAKELSSLRLKISDELGPFSPVLEINLQSDSEDAPPRLVIENPQLGFAHRNKLTVTTSEFDEYGVVKHVYRIADSGRQGRLHYTHNIYRKWTSARILGRAVKIMRWVLLALFMFGTWMAFYEQWKKENVIVVPRAIPVHVVKPVSRSEMRALTRRNFLASSAAFLGLGANAAWGQAAGMPVSARSVPDFTFFSPQYPRPTAAIISEKYGRNLAAGNAWIMEEQKTITRQIESETGKASNYMFRLRSKLALEQLTHVWGAGETAIVKNMHDMLVLLAVPESLSFKWMMQRNSKKEMISVAHANGVETGYHSSMRAQDDLDWLTSPEWKAHMAESGSLRNAWNHLRELTALRLGLGADPQSLDSWMENWRQMAFQHADKLLTPVIDPEDREKSILPFEAWFVQSQIRKDRRDAIETSWKSYQVVFQTASEGSVRNEQAEKLRRDLLLKIQQVIRDDMLGAYLAEVLVADSEIDVLFGITQLVRQGFLYAHERRVAAISTKKQFDAARAEYLATRSLKIGKRKKNADADWEAAQKAWAQIPAEYKTESGRDYLRDEDFSTYIKDRYSDNFDPVLIYGNDYRRRSLDTKKRQLIPVLRNIALNPTMQANKQIIDGAVRQLSRNEGLLLSFDAAGDWVRNEISTASLRAADKARAGAIASALPVKNPPAAIPVSQPSESLFDQEGSGVPAVEVLDDEQFRQKQILFWMQTMNSPDFSIAMLTSLSLAAGLAAYLKKFRPRHINSADRTEVKQVNQSTAHRLRYAALAISISGITFTSLWILAVAVWGMSQGILFSDILLQVQMWPLTVSFTATIIGLAGEQFLLVKKRQPLAQRDKPASQRPEVRQKYEAAAQPYFDYLAAGDEIGWEDANAIDLSMLPDAFLLLGNPDLKTFIRFAELFLRLPAEKQKKIKIILAGGIGRGTLPLLKAMIREFPGASMKGRPLENHLKDLEAYLADTTSLTAPFYESDLMEFILLQKGVQPQVEGEYSFLREPKPSKNTSANFENTLPVIHNEIKPGANIGLVTAPWLLKRVLLTGYNVWMGKGAASLRLKRVQAYRPLADAMSDDELLALGEYVHGDKPLWGEEEKLGISLEAGRANSIDNDPAKSELKGIVQQARQFMVSGDSSILPSDLNYSDANAAQLTAARKAYQGWLANRSETRGFDKGYFSDPQNIKKIKNIVIYDPRHDTWSHSAFHVWMLLPSRLPEIFSSHESIRLIGPFFRIFNLRSAGITGDGGTKKVTARFADQLATADKYDLESTLFIGRKDDFADFPNALVLDLIGDQLGLYQGSAVIDSERSSSVHHAGHVAHFLNKIGLPVSGVPTVLNSSHLNDRVADERKKMLQQIYRLNSDHQFETGRQLVVFHPWVPRQDIKDQRQALNDHLSAANKILSEHRDYFVVFNAGPSDWGNAEWNRLRDKEFMPALKKLKKEFPERFLLTEPESQRSEAELFRLFALLTLSPPDRTAVIAESSAAAHFADWLHIPTFVRKRLNHAGEVEEFMGPNSEKRVHRWSTAKGLIGIIHRVFPSKIWKSGMGFDVDTVTDRLDSVDDDFDDAAGFDPSGQRSEVRRLLLSDFKNSRPTQTITSRFRVTFDNAYENLMVRSEQITSAEQLAAVIAHVFVRPDLSPENQSYLLSVLVEGIPIDKLLQARQILQTRHADLWKAYSARAVKSVTLTRELSVSDLKNDEIVSAIASSMVQAWIFNPELRFDWIVKGRQDVVLASKLNSAVKAIAAGKDISGRFRLSFNEKGIAGIQLKAKGVYSAPVLPDAASSKAVLVEESWQGNITDTAGRIRAHRTAILLLTQLAQSGTLTALLQPYFTSETERLSLTARGLKLALEEIVSQIEKITAFAAAA